jgi:hypothetical protein
MEIKTETTELGYEELIHINGGDKFMKDLGTAVGRLFGKISKVMDHETEYLGILLYN